MALKVLPTHTGECYIVTDDLVIKKEVLQQWLTRCGEDSVDTAEVDGWGS